MPRIHVDPCRLVRQVKKFIELPKLLHPPGKPAGVGGFVLWLRLAAELLNLPDKPAGVD